MTLSPAINPLELTALNVVVQAFGGWIVLSVPDTTKLALFGAVHCTSATRAEALGAKDKEDAAIIVTAIKLETFRLRTGTPKKLIDA